MKKFVLLFCLLCLCSGVFAQESGTTVEEYNYCVKGFKIQQESGLDMKKGYSISQITPFNENGGAITIRLLLREIDNETQEVACTIIRYKGHSIDKYLCLPTRNASNELWDAYIKSVETLRYGSSDGEAIYKGYSIALSKFCSSLLYRISELIKKP